MKWTQFDTHESTSQTHEEASEHFKALVQMDPARIVGTLGTLVGLGWSELPDVVRRIDRVVSLAPKRRRSRSRPDLFMTVLCVGDEVVLSLVPPTESSLRGSARYPQEFISLMRHAGYLSFPAHGLRVLCPAESSEVRWPDAETRPLIPWFPHGNGDYDVITDGTLLEYHHETDDLLSEPLSLAEWFLQRVQQLAGPSIEPSS